MGCILSTMATIEQPTEIQNPDDSKVEHFMNLTIIIPRNEEDTNTDTDIETKAHESAKLLEKELFGSTPKLNVVIQTLQKDTSGIIKNVSFHDLTKVHEYTPLSNESVCSDEYEMSPRF